MILSPGLGASGTVSFAWLTPPADSFSLTYRLSVPEDAAGIGVLRGWANYRSSGLEAETGLLVSVVNPAAKKGLSPKVARWSGIFGEIERERVLRTR